MKKIKLNTTVVVDEAREISSSVDEQTINCLDDVSKLYLFSHLYYADKHHHDACKVINGTSSTEGQLTALKNQLDAIDNAISDILSDNEDERIVSLNNERSEISSSIAELNIKLKNLKDELKSFKINENILKTDSSLINYVKDEGEIGLYCDDEIKGVIYPKVLSTSYSFVDGVNVEEQCNANEMLANSVVASYLIVPTESNKEELNRLCDQGILKKVDNYELKVSTTASKIRTFDSSCEDISEGGE